MPLSGTTGHEDRFQRSEVRFAALAAPANSASATGTAQTAGAATLNSYAGKVTTDALSTAALGLYTLTITNSYVSASDMVFVSVDNGTNTGLNHSLNAVTPGDGVATIAVNTVSALNGTLVFSFLAVKRESWPA